MADWGRPFEDPPTNGGTLSTLQDDADGMVKLPEDVRDPLQNQNTPR